jgi:hypothetical protein
MATIGSKRSSDKPLQANPNGDDRNPYKKVKGSTEKEAGAAFTASSIQPAQSGAGSATSAYGAKTAGSSGGAVARCSSSASTQPLEETDEIVTRFSSAATQVIGAVSSLTATAESPMLARDFFAGYPEAEDGFALDVHTHAVVNFMARMRQPGPSQILAICESVSFNVFASSSQNSGLVAHFKGCQSVDDLPAAGSAFLEGQFSPGLQHLSLGLYSSFTCRREVLRIMEDQSSLVIKHYTDAFALAMRNLMDAQRQCIQAVQAVIPVSGLGQLVSSYGGVDPLSLLPYPEFLYGIRTFAKNRSTEMADYVRKTGAVVAESELLRLQDVSKLYFRRLFVYALEAYHGRDTDDSPLDLQFLVKLIGKSGFRTEESYKTMIELVRNPECPVDHAHWNKVQGSVLTVRK